MKSQPRVPVVTKVRFRSAASPLPLDCVIFAGEMLELLM